MNVSDMLVEPVDKTALAIRKNLAQVKTALTEFDKISAGLADLAARYPVDLVYDVTTGKGMADAIAHRAAWRDPRINVEKYRKTAKAPVLALGNDIDARASWLTEQLLIGETPVHEQIKAEENRKAAVAQAKIDAEVGRVIAIQEAIEDIHMDSMTAGKPSSVITGILEAMRVRFLDPKVFQEMMAQAKAAQTSAIGRLEQALKAQLFSEAETAKLVAERAELETLRKAAAEQKAKDAAAAAEAVQAEQSRVAAERKAADEAAVAARAEADRIAAEARAKAQAEHEAAMQAQRQHEAADQKLRDAAPKMLAALRGCREYLPEGHALAMVDAAIEAAS